VSLPILLAALCAPSTTFAGGNAGSTTVYSESFQFTMPAGQCPSLPPDLSVTFSATVHGHVHASVDAQGRLHINWPDTISGTAVDSDGNTYRFNYHNVSSWTEGELPIEIRISDHFNLVGFGPANNLHTFFVARLLITEEGDEFVIVAEHGDPPSCDAL
jgi:hypothetical protein